jgi:hypothetical protein
MSEEVPFNYYQELGTSAIFACLRKIIINCSVTFACYRKATVDYWVQANKLDFVRIESLLSDYLGDRKPNRKRVSEVKFVFQFHLQILFEIFLLR